MNRQNFHLLMMVLVLGSAGLQASHAQIPDVEVQIVNPLKVTLPAMERNFDRVAIKPPDPVYPPLVYEFAPLIFEAPPFLPVVRPLRISMPKDELPLRGYASLGFGNYASPYGEAFFPVFSGGKGSRSGGVRLFHHSFLNGPVDGRNSGSGTSSVSIDLRSVTGAALSEAQLGWRNRYSGFYGYVPGTTIARKDIAHGYNQVNMSYALQTLGKSKARLRLSPSFSYLWDNLSASEADVNIGLESRVGIGKYNSLILQGDAGVLARKDVEAEAKPRQLIQVSTLYDFSVGDGITVQAGAHFAFENDTLLSGSLHVYPLAKATWKATSVMTGIFSVSGGVEKVSLHRLSGENIWLDQNINLAHGNRLLEVDAQVHAGMKGGFSLAGGFSYTDFGNQYFYLNSSTVDPLKDRSRFSVVYDDASRINAYGIFSFQRGSSSLNMRADYFKWTVNELSAAFHRPTYQVDLNAAFKIAGKLLVRPGVLVRGGIQALEDTSLDVITLPMATDLGVRMDYTFSERGAILIRFNNLLNSSYSLYQYYPVRGIQGMAGLTWKF